MAPKLAAQHWSIPEITTTGMLAELLGIECSHLDWLADPMGRERQTEQEKLRHYRYNWVQKKSGGQRLIEMPKRRLKSIQRWVLDEILQFVPVHEAAHGFVHERSVLSAAAPHVGQFVVMRMVA